MSADRPFWRPNHKVFRCSTTGRLQIPRSGPYEERADGERSRLRRVRASGKSLSFTSAAIASQRMMTGARRTPLLNPSGAIGLTPCGAAEGGTSKRRRYPLKWDNRSLARDATASGRKAAGTGRAGAASERTCGSAPRCRSTMRFGVHGRGAFHSSVVFEERRQISAGSLADQGCARSRCPIRSSSPTTGPCIVPPRRCGVDPAAHRPA